VVVQREKKTYDKSRANYDAAVLKVRSINAKKGQVNLEKLAEAEDERDRLKEVRTCKRTSPLTRGLHNAHASTI
jgi:hypothetical protein